MDVTPALVLAMWACGLAAGGAVVSWWRIVGPGYGWLSGGVVLLFGVPAAAAGAGAWAWAGVALAVGYLVSARRWALAAILGALAAIAFLGAALAESAHASVVSGAVFLGGISTEMMLGHWYLVDPRLPRRSLRRLAVVGGVGAVADLVMLSLAGVFPWDEADTAAGIGYLVLVVVSVLLMAGVVGALRERGYSGVMAATGLSYLAVLTGIGATVVGRLLLNGPILG